MTRTHWRLAMLSAPLLAAACAAAPPKVSRPAAVVIVPPLVHVATPLERIEAALQKPELPRWPSIELTASVASTWPSVEANPAPSGGQDLRGACDAA